MVLSAGVGNDIVGWILLALCVALVNAGSGITALYVLLVAVGYILFLVFAVRPSFIWLLKRTGSFQNGPSQSIVALTVLMVFTSAFFTSIIGVHPIFGAFLIGVICPHDGGFAIKLTEKIEDLVAVFFLPLYFALSGLSTNLGLLNDGITWAYVVGVISVAFIGKMIGGTLAARSCKLVWRESFTIGALMSCKGLVELIVLNIGLQAKILSQRTFTIFVVMALVTTFVTTPLVTALFPPWYQKKLAAWKRGEIDWDGNRLLPDGDFADAAFPHSAEKGSGDIQKLLVCLRLDSLPSLFTFVSLLSGDSQNSSSKPRIHPGKVGKSTTTAEHNTLPDIRKQRPLEIHGLRMLELTERLSSVMKESEVEEWSSRDLVVNAFYAFSQLSNVAVSGEVQLVNPSAYADLLNERASQRASDLILLPWSETGTISETSALDFVEVQQNAFANDSYNELIAKFLARAPCATAVLVNNGFGTLPRDEERPHSRHGISRVFTGQSHRSEHVTHPIADRSHHIFFPFTGGLDSQVALRFVLQLAKSPNVTATILLIDNTTTSTTTTTASAEIDHDDDKGQHDTNKPTNKATTSTNNLPLLTENDRTFFYTMRDSLLPDSSIHDRILFDTLSITTMTNPLNDILTRASAEVSAGRGKAGDLVVVARGLRDGNNGSSSSEASGSSSGGLSPLGPLAEKVIGAAHVGGSVLVVQAGR